MAKRVLFLVLLIGLGSPAWALSSIVTDAISAALLNMLALWKMFLLMGLALWAASLVQRWFAIPGDDSSKWNTYRFAHSDGVHKVRRKRDGSRGFDAQYGQDGLKTYHFKD